MILQNMVLAPVDSCGEYASEEVSRLLLSVYLIFVLL